jgi:hypothetical protein
LYDGTPATFECNGVPRAEIHQVVLSHQSAMPNRTLPPGVAFQTAYHTTSVTVYYQCQVTHTWTYVPILGEYVYSYFTVDGCWITEIVSNGGGGSGTGDWVDENGNPVPPPSDPVQTPDAVVSDTCKIVTGDRVVTRELDTLSVLFEGSLNDGAIQDSLRAAHLDSYGTIADPLPLSQRDEIGGVIAYNFRKKTYEFHRIPATSSSHCHYIADPPDLPQGVVAVGWWHTHVLRDGDIYDCPFLGTMGVTANAEASGGGSEADWELANTYKMPVYTIDPDRIWRLEPNTPPDMRPANPQRWAKGSFGQCVDVAPS